MTVGIQPATTDHFFCNHKVAAGLLCRTRRFDTGLSTEGAERGMKDEEKNQECGVVIEARVER